MDRRPDPALRGDAPVIAGASSGGRYVFGTDLHALRAQTSVQRHKRLCAQAGMPEITLHQLRHTAATLLLEQGVPPKVVGDMLGHSSIEITIDPYSHASADMQRAASASLAKALSEDENKPEHRATSM